MIFEMSSALEDLPRPVMPSCSDQLLLRGQKALVTGASSGIGKQVAIALGHAGADVVVNYVADPDKAEEAVAEIHKQCGVNAYAYQADVSSEEQVQGMFQHMYKEFGTIDILVNNAGLQQRRAPGRDDPGRLAHGARRQSDRPISMFPRRRSANSTTAASCRNCPAPPARSSACRSVHDVIPVGGPRQLRRIQGRGQPADEDHGSGTRAAPYPGQRHLARRDQDPDQYRRLEDARGRGGTAEADPLPAGRGSRKTSPTPRSGWLPTPPITSPAPPCMWTAA